MMLELCDLDVGYPGRQQPVLSSLALQVKEGTFVCVLGRNGAGKSTLMRTLAGLQTSLRGRTFLDGEDLHDIGAAARARKIAVVLTDRIASPGLRVADIVCMARQPFTQWQGRLLDHDKAIVDGAFSAMQLQGYRHRLFDSLSDGERQRVLVARALAQTPKLVILDEITAFLDLPGRVEVMGLLRRLAHEKQIVVLLSSHDLELALEMADQVWLLDGKGSMHVGSAANLINSGIVNKAFDTSEVAFCREAGRFKLA